MAQANRSLSDPAGWRLEILSIIDGTARQAERHYDVYLMGLMGAFARAIDSQEPFSAVSRNRLADSANTLQVALVGALSKLARETREDLVARAIEAGNRFMGEEKNTIIKELAREAEGEAFQHIINAVLTDANTVKKALRNFALQVETKVMQGVSRYGAVIMTRPGVVRNVQFHQIDRAGHKWNSALYVRTTLRALFLQLYVEPYLFGVSARPLDQAVVVHDEGHKNNGLVFSITGATLGMPTFEEIRGDVFHPNSRALVRW